MPEVRNMPLHGLVRPWLSILMVLALALAATFGTQVAARSPAPGTEIANQAITTYWNPQFGLLETVRSNTVVATVQAVAAVELSGFTDLRLTRGAVDQHYFEVRNDGNVDVSIGLTLVQDMERGILGNQKLFWDRNRNAIIDADDPVVERGAPLPVEVGARQQMIYQFRVRDEARLGDEAWTSLGFDQTTTQAVGRGNIPLVTRGEGRGRVIVSEGTFELQKSVAPRKTATGTDLTYTIAVRNNATMPIPPYTTIGTEEILIDGAPRRVVLVRDEIPLNTVFQAIGPSSGFVPVYHRIGAPMQSYVSAPPADFAQIDALGWVWDGTFEVGQSADLEFTVTVPGTLGDLEVENVAGAYHPGGPDFDIVPSNPVTLDVAGDGAALRFNRAIAALNEDQSLTLSGGACNVSDAIDSVEITVRSQLTGDLEIVTATETGPNTGTFATGPLPLLQMSRPVHHDGVMATEAGDTLTGAALCGDLRLSATLPVVPGNVVFNSVSNAPVAGAEVILRDMSGREVARRTSDARGFFSFGTMGAGRYVYDVQPPSGLSFPSDRDSFPDFGRSVRADAGYGAAFSHDGQALAPSDIPLDPGYTMPITLEKSAGKTRIETGESLRYTLVAANQMDEALVDAVIIDTPPAGMDYVDGSLRVDGDAAPDPATGPDGAMRISLGTLAPKARVTISYVLRATPALDPGSLVNVAQLSGQRAGLGSRVISNEARAEVTLDDRGGVFSPEGVVVGTVYLDCDANGVKGLQEDEPGVPGVRIVTQTGLTVVTDHEGKYSLFGLRPVTHAFVIDHRTLPAGAEALATRTMDLRRGGSRLVDLKRGELRNESFALSCPATARSETAERIALFAARQAGTGPERLGDLPLQAGRPAPLSARTEAGLATQTQLSPAGVARAVAEDAETPAQDGTRANLEEMVVDMDATLGFLDLPADSRTRRSTVSLRVKGPADLDLTLTLNGSPVPASRVGERTSWAAGNVQAMEFVALELRPGRNVLTLAGTDPFGIPRASAEAVITAPGAPARLAIIAPDEAPASAGTAVPVLVQIRDAAGRPVETSSLVTLSAQHGQWDVADIRPETPGTQVYLDNGEATFDLLAPQVSGPDRITATSSFGTAEARLNWVPDLDARILVGVIEGAVALGGENVALDHDKLSPFEETATGLRGELYLKGRIRGDALLTLRYSSDRDTEDRLFRDIRTDEYYPVYGDASERGYDAASSTNLYVKIEKGASYILYGDFAIEPASDAYELGAYDRVTTGLKGHWQGEDVAVTVFAARTRQGQKIEEVPARGISGPYDLDLTDIKEGSERVDLLVRDRISGEIIEERSQIRLTDYVLDYFRGAILFNAPVAQTDASGNPISIRIRYETESDTTERYWLYGAEVLWQAGARTEMGLRVVHADAEEMTEERERVMAAFLRSWIGERTEIEAEIAHSEDGAGVAGTGARVAVTHYGKGATMRLEAASTDEDFAPTGASVGPGIDQISLGVETLVFGEDRLEAELQYVRDRINETERLNGEATVEIARKPDETLRAGLRFEHDMHDPDADIRLYGILGATWSRSPGEDGRPMTFGFDMLTPVSGGTEGFARFSAQYAATDKLRFNLDGEVTLFGDDTPERLSYLSFSVDYAVSEHVTARSEMQAEGHDLEAARMIQSMRAAWSPIHGVDLRFGVEHTHGLGTDEDWLTAVTFGMDWMSEDGNWIADLDLETTFEDAGDTFYANVGVAGHITPELSVLGRVRHAVDDTGAGDVRIRQRARIGAAYRPLDDDRLNVLAWYERRFEQDGLREDAHLWSFAAAYRARENLDLRGKYAGIHRETRFEDGVTSAATTQLVQAGLDWDFADDRFRLGLQASHLWDSEGYATQAIGAEFGIAMAEGTLLAVGYNHLNKMLPGAEDLIGEGFYVRLRLLLDTSLWDRLERWLD